MESLGGSFGGLSLDLSLTPDEPLDPEPLTYFQFFKDI